MEVILFLWLKLIFGRNEILVDPFSDLSCIAKLIVRTRGFITVEVLIALTFCINGYLVEVPLLPPNDALMKNRRVEQTYGPGVRSFE